MANLNALKNLFSRLKPAAKTVANYGDDVAKAAVNYGDDVARNITEVSDQVTPLIQYDSAVQHGAIPDKLNKLLGTDRYERALSALGDVPTEFDSQLNDLMNAYKTLPRSGGANYYIRQINTPVAPHITAYPGYQPRLQRLHDSMVLQGFNPYDLDDALGNMLYNRDLPF